MVRHRECTEPFVRTDFLQLTHLHTDFSYGPGCVVADRDELWVQICPKDWHELSCSNDKHYLKNLNMMFFIANEKK